MGLRVLGKNLERCDEGVYEPHVICDWCGQPITEACKGNVNFWTEGACSKPLDEVLLFFHKGDCQRSFARATFGSEGGWRDKMAWQELESFLFYLTHNTNWDMEHARERLGLPKPEPRRGLSPIERQFLDAWEKTGGPKITARHRVSGKHGRYRLDFAIIEEKIAIELDGWRNHHTTDQIADDHKRQRDIEALGWRVIRFGGKEIHHSVEQCVAELKAIIGWS